MTNVLNWAASATCTSLSATEIGGSLTGSITVNGNSSSNIKVTGDIDGDITIGNYTGTIGAQSIGSTATIHLASGSATISAPTISGVIRVDANFTGTIEANGLTPETIPSSWSISPSCGWYVKDLLTGYRVQVPCQPATILYVDAGAPAGGNGQSWTTAYKYLQDALASLPTPPNHQLWVASGVYRPDQDVAHPNGTGSRSATFQLRTGIAIYGGFPTGGGDGTSGARNSKLYLTTLSGDIGTFGLPGDNSYHVVTASDTNETAVLDGVTVTGGNADGAPALNGGGLFCERGAPQIRGCTFINNTAPTGYGGGLWFDQPGAPGPVIAGCLIESNTALGSGGIRFGSAAPPYSDHPVRMMNCIVRDNTATSAYGGGIGCAQNDGLIANCLIVGNHAVHGGGIVASDSGERGPVIVNCTIVENCAENTGGGLLSSYCPVTAANGIIYGNTSPPGPQVSVEGTPSPVITSSDVHGEGPAGTT